MRRDIYFILLVCCLLREALGDPQMPRPPKVYGSQFADPGSLKSGPKGSGDPGDALQDDLSPGAFFKIKEDENAPVGLGFDVGGSAQGPNPNGPAGPLGYEHFDLATLQAMARAQQEMKENYALSTAWPMGSTTERKEELIIYNLCFSLSYMWRRGRQSIRKYFHLRDIYFNHIEYEVGYLTHAIMIKYQNILELYQYCASLVSSSTAKSGMKISSIHMTHFHKSIEEDTRSIVQMCNMMHELKPKYASRPYDPHNRFELPRNGTTTVASSKEKSEEKEERARDEKKKFIKIDKSYLAKRIEQSHKLIDEALAQRKKKIQEARAYYEKHRYEATTKRTQQTMRLWSPNLDYGWSGEEEDW